MSPIYWNYDKEYFLKEFPGQYDILQKVLYRTYNEYSHSLLSSEDGLIFEIKPDILADYLRSQVFTDDKMERAWKRLIQYTPSRVSTNVSMLLFDNKTQNVAFRILLEIWMDFNSKIGSNIEYLLTLSYFSSHLARDGLLYLLERYHKKANVDI